MTYCAVVLDNTSAELLKTLFRLGVLRHLGLEEEHSDPSKRHGFVFYTKNGDPLPHHMTICLGEFDTKLNTLDMLNEPACIWIDSIWIDLDLGVACAGVSDSTSLDGEVEVRSSNKHKHVTIALKGNAKPFESNKVLEKTPDESSDFECDCNIGPFTSGVLKLTLNSRVRLTGIVRSNL